jgi:hypothetical protein
MKLYVNGCSFSHGHKDFRIKDGVSDISPDWVWPMLMKEHFDEVVSEAYRGSSNHRILRRSMEYLNTINNPEEWSVIIQFANIERQEYFDEDLNCWIGHIVDDPCIDDRAPAIGNDELNNKLNYKAFKNYCALVNNEKSIITDLALQVMAFQGFCKIKGFKNVFYTGQSKQTMISYYLQNKLLDSVLHNIDTSNFLLPISHLTRGNEESATDGHPNETGHKLFARYIINEIQK